MSLLFDACDSFMRKLGRGVRRHGLIGLLQVALQKVVRQLSLLRPLARSELKERAQRALEFDVRFGVDTGGLIHPTELGIDSPNQLHAVSYRGSDPTQRSLAPCHQPEPRIGRKHPRFRADSSSRKRRFINEAVTRRPRR